ncbi:hypothetical protein SASPL_143879 [Salvia splendens]|uniref:XPG N-terminal domain-containing protein n=1 Tax=Salvia splendens TaxID=180675 RepID=A0A8X8ZB87_SALSN|nr:hypothetical protein SASPL_143879 [Salvia splendens]
MSIYQFLIVVGRSGTEMLTNEAGDVTSHLQGMFSRTIRLLEAGIKPVYSKRAHATEELNNAQETENKEEIEKLSKRTVKAPSECAALCKSDKEEGERYGGDDHHKAAGSDLGGGVEVCVVSASPSRKGVVAAAVSMTVAELRVLVVYAVASEDMDSRHVMDPSSKKIPVMEFEVSKTQLSLNAGIGGMTALKLIRQHGSIENILENINKERYQIPEEWPYQEARMLFKEPSVLTNDDDLKWSSPDEEGLISFLVNENGFNSDRVTKAIEKIKTAKNKSSQGRLESFFKPVAYTSVPAK